MEMRAIKVGAAIAVGVAGLLIGVPQAQAASGGGCASIITYEGVGWHPCIGANVTSIGADGYTTNSGPAGCVTQVRTYKNGAQVNSSGWKACSTHHIVAPQVPNVAGQYQSVMDIYPHGLASGDGKSWISPTLYGG